MKVKMTLIEMTFAYISQLAHKFTTYQRSKKRKKL